MFDSFLFIYWFCQGAGGAKRTRELNEQESHNVASLPGLFREPSRLVEEKVVSRLAPGWVERRLKDTVWVSDSME